MTDSGLADSELPGPAHGWQVQAGLPGGARMLFGVCASTERTATIKAMQVLAGSVLANADIDVTPVLALPLRAGRTASGSSYVP